MQGLGAQAHGVAAAFIDHHAAGEGLVVGFDEEGPLPPVQHVSLHEDHVLNARNLQGRDSGGACRIWRFRRDPAGLPTSWPGSCTTPSTPRPNACPPAEALVPSPSINP